MRPRPGGRGSFCDRSGLGPEGWLVLAPLVEACRPENFLSLPRKVPIGPITACKVALFDLELAPIGE